ncbi:MAG TPA: M48 family metallopeptidase [Ktedonobacteraceae bacterium]|jgi:Zn-dependent protease with chaperone function|nr:M48 family metallopeptidase [Ktedonobacteraceae bacterium]
MSTAQPKARRHFPELDVSALQHPYDRAALSALQRVPGLDIVVRKFIELLPERVAYIQNVAQMVRATPRQCSHLYAQLQEACAILDVREPELYVAQYPAPNAYTSGHDHPYIVVTTGLLDLMNEDEVLAVIAHELGHIKSGHVLYKTMARGISFVLTIVGDMTLGIGRLVGRSLEAALLEWDRKSEFTADRAGLLAVQDPQVMLSLMMKLAGGTLFQRDEMDASEFLNQANLYEEVDSNLLDRLYKLLMVSSVSHPLTIVRAREIMNWSESREYNDIFAGSYPRVVHLGTNGNQSKNTNSADTIVNDPVLIVCPHCGREQTNRRFCSLCGSPIA